MKRKLFFMCLFLTSVVAVRAQEELLENAGGKFLSDGTKGWRLSGFERGVESTNYYVARTGYVDDNFVQLSTSGQAIKLVKGEEYEFSFYAKGRLRAQNMTIYFRLLDKDGRSVHGTYNGINFSALKMPDGTNSGSWLFYSKKFTFPDDAAELTEIRITCSGGNSQLSYSAIAEVSLKGPKVISVPAPNNLKVESFQREMLVSWDAVQGADKYLLEIIPVSGGNKVFSKEITGTSYMVTGLEVNTRYEIFVKATQENALVAKKTEFTVEPEIGNEADRIPYVLLDKVSNPFFVHIYDTNEPLTVKSVVVDGQEVTANADGTYTLPTGANKTLKFFFSDTEGQKWEFEYKGVTVN